MNKIQYCNNKALKLTNVLKYKISISDKDFDLSACIEQMKSYIKTKGASQVGPLIQYTHTFANEIGQIDMDIFMMLQCNNFIHNVEQPYSMESVIRVPNALYCRYTGPESSLKLAYDKVQLEAFEQNIKLEDCNYTIFISSNEDDDVMVADVFVPRASSI